LIDSDQPAFFFFLYEKEYLTFFRW